MIRVRSYLSQLQGNSRYCIAFHPLWGIPYNIYFFYLSLYMQANGVTDKQLGYLVFVGAFTSLVFSMFAAPIVDHLGRKKATLIFDLISSALPPLIYFISGSFLFAVIGFVLSNTNKIMSVAYYLIMIEDADTNETLTAFNLFNLISIISGTVIPVAGYFVEKYGLVETERVFLMIAFLSMTSLIIARNHYLVETTIGKVKKQNSERLTLESIKLPYKDAFAYLRENKTSRFVVLANILFYVYLIIGTNQSVYFAPYLVDVLGMSVYESSILGSIYSIGMLISMTVIIPKISPSKIHRGNVVASLITILGLVFLVAIPSGSFVMSIISIFILSIGYGMIRPMIDTALAISTEGDSRSGIYSIINAVSSIAGMVAAIAISFLYARFKKSIFYISIVILFFLAVLFHNAFKNERKRNVI